MQWVAERELIFGLHVHVGMRSGDEAIWVANALRTWLPELLALSANSPFWQGRDTGLASTRIKVFEPFPRSGLPPTFASVAALVALVQSLAATLAERHEREGSLPIQPITLISENKWRATRYGLDADLIWLERDEERPAREALRHLVELVEPAARRLGCAAELALVEDVLRRGTGADEQRRVHADGESLLAVARFLARTTIEGLPS